MRLLVIGGGVFLGPAVVDAALARGWTVTLLHRGNHGPELYPDVEHIHGDRRTVDLSGRTWDLCVDTCVYRAEDVVPLPVHRILAVSTVSVYQDPFPAEITVDSPLRTADDYGGHKAAMERAATARFGDRVSLIRAGLIVGPNDRSGRFAYWVDRVARGGDLLAPDAPDVPVQFIDVRDLAAWMLDRPFVPGPVNAVGPSRRFGDMLAEIAEALGTKPAFHWVPEARLLAAGVEPWQDLPLWLPREMASGLRIRPPLDLVTRPVAESALATVGQEPSGMSAERERSVLGVAISGEIG